MQWNEEGTRHAQPRYRAVRKKQRHNVAGSRHPILPICRPPVTAWPRRRRIGHPARSRLCVTFQHIIPTAECPPLFMADTVIRSACSPLRTLRSRVHSASFFTRLLSRDRAGENNPGGPWTQPKWRGGPSGKTMRACVDLRNWAEPRKRLCHSCGGRNPRTTGGEVHSEMDSRLRGNDKRGPDTSQEAVGSGRHGPIHRPPLLPAPRENAVACLPLSCYTTATGRSRCVTRF